MGKSEDIRRAQEPQRLQGMVVDISGDYVV